MSKYLNNTWRYFLPPTLASANNKCECWAKSQLKVSLLGKPRDHHQLRQIQYIFTGHFELHMLNISIYERS